MSRDGILDAGAARRLAAMLPNVVDARRSTALKRNVHEIDVDASAPRVAAALADVLADPEARFGVISVRRPPARTGRTFVVGDRFTGAFRVAAAATAWGAPAWLRALLARADRAGVLPWLENRLTSDHAELTELRAIGDTHQMAYRYLAGTPLAGESRYAIAPHPGDRDRCRMTVTFAFQETTAWAVLLLHGFGIRQHDRAVLAQAEAAARRIGARVVAHTIQSTS